MKLTSSLKLNISIASLHQFHNSYGKNDLILFTYWCDFEMKWNAWHGKCVIYIERHVTMWHSTGHTYFIADHQSIQFYTHIFFSFFQAFIVFSFFPYLYSLYCTKRALNFWYNLIYKFNMFEMFFMFLLFFSAKHTQYDYKRANHFETNFQSIKLSWMVGSFNIFIIFDFFFFFFLLLLLACVYTL